VTGQEGLAAAALLLVAVAGTTVVFTPRPARQAVNLSFLGLMLTVLFVVLQAPDVALSQLAVGTVFVPLMVVLSVAKTGGDTEAPRGADGDEEDGDEEDGGDTGESGEGDDESDRSHR
jgi:energy-converting hydrogenase B subunit D